MDTQKLITDKIATVLAATSKDHAVNLKQLIEESGRIFVGGAGRSLLVARFFAMRLVHCGYQVNMPGEIVTPAIVPGDLLIVISGSGGTKTLLPMLETAKAKGAKIIVISMKASSAMSDLADYTVQVGNDNSFPLTKGLPMGTAFELSTLVYLEAVIGEIVFDKDLTEEGMRAIHANLE
ncbi:SIS domain-containing protein [Methylophilaceae bacterium]|jgi:6-phospho-3-hexuloisomerase|uniref:SIS domain protein n=1 Tax=Methylophilales bacterium HTCC2181 TaxID=383631 RepID=A0P6T3_9PROT|nr:SIS domain protein [Methylophilales bacterium HTCC2181]MBT3512810.1 SIS domain-containing protein [Nitrosomonadales bacterium]MCH9781675.1 SIS domain-containing protein [Betaproteobacteria bacterium]MDA7751130.1 SIS domain-containing protein [Methylophilaceae bacterium]MBT5410831.1 SIS domain-containing protein [Nitrosomonadales bacterium]|tara:strand:+ start:3568 stop:4104 length:537 start_codon:yes stop_codon:yes gene_type:complete